MKGIAPKRGRGGGARNADGGNKRVNTNSGANGGAGQAAGRSSSRQSLGGGSSWGGGGGSGDGRGGGGGDARVCPGHGEECALRTVAKEVRVSTSLTLTVFVRSTVREITAWAGGSELKADREITNV